MLGISMSALLYRMEKYGINGTTSHCLTCRLAIFIENQYVIHAPVSAPRMAPPIPIIAASISDILLQPTIKIVSGLEQGGIPHTIGLNEAAAQELWGFNRATSFSVSKNSKASKGEERASFEALYWHLLKFPSHIELQKGS